MSLSIFRISGSKRRTKHLGLGGIEVIVIIGIIGFAIVLVLMALPRGRETSRMASCQNNLRQIGVGLAMYHQATSHYPTVPALAGSTDDGPIKAMLDSLVIPDLLDLRDPSIPLKPGQPPPTGLRVPGLACPSDPNAMIARSLPIISYRANTGDDVRGLGGPFQPGRVMTATQIEAADGASYTAAFAERLVGDGRALPALWNYASVPALPDGPGNPVKPTDPWQGDAGADWAEASWRSTLYNHSRVPNTAPSYIVEGRRFAMMGASSGHVDRVNVLMMDGSLRAITPSIDPKVWGSLGTVETSGASHGR